MPLRTSARALQASLHYRVRTVPVACLGRWLARGWQDFMRAPLPGLLHGLLLVVFGGALLLLARQAFWLLAGAFTGFLLVAPVLATGLYAVSRAAERGEPVSLRTAWRAWYPDDGRRVLFGVLLAFAGTGWVLTSAALVTGFTAMPVHNPQDFLRHVVLAERGFLFEAWLALGALLAAPVFASTVVAVPMLLDTRIGVLGAVLTSWRVVLQNPVPMALWALLLAAITALAMLPALLGLLVVVPWLAHASWHAWRDLVELPGAQGLPR